MCPRELTSNEIVTWHNIEREVVGLTQDGGSKKFGS